MSMLGTMSFCHSGPFWPKVFLPGKDINWNPGTLVYEEEGLKIFHWRVLSKHLKLLKNCQCTVAKRTWWLFCWVSGPLIRG